MKTFIPSFALSLFFITGFMSASHAEVCSYYWDSISAHQFTPDQKKEIEAELYKNGRRYVRVRDPHFAELYFSIQSGDGGFITKQGKKQLLQGVDYEFRKGNTAEGATVFSSSQRLPLDTEHSFKNILKAIDKDTMPCSQIVH